MKRISRLREKLSEIGVDGLLITDELNIRYITELDVSDAYVLVTVKKAYLLTDFRYYEIAAKSLSSDFEVAIPKSKLDFVKEIMSSDGLSSLGFEGKCISYDFYLSLSEKLGGIRLCDVKALFSELRAIKSPEEIEKIQKAQDIADRAFSELLKVLTHFTGHAS